MPCPLDRGRHPSASTHRSPLGGGARLGGRRAGSGTVWRIPRRDGSSHKARSASEGIDSVPRGRFAPCVNTARPYHCRRAGSVLILCFWAQHRVEQLVIKAPDVPGHHGSRRPLLAGAPGLDTSTWTRSELLGLLGVRRIRKKAVDTSLWSRYTCAQNDRDRASRLFLWRCRELHPVAETPLPRGAPTARGRLRGGTPGETRSPI